MCSELALGDWFTGGTLGCLWFIAQEVKELCDRLGVDFGGYQGHSINGGCDVLSLGYDEFIPPTVKAVQQCWRRLDEVELRLDNLDPPAVSS